MAKKIRQDNQRSIEDQNEDVRKEQPQKSKLEVITIGVTQYVRDINGSLVNAGLPDSAYG